MPPKNNTLPSWGNESSMNLNPMILTNIQSSPYFKNELFKLKTYHEVIDEIYYKVAHLEPWERGSRQTSGQIGMCGGVRGVGAGGIVSSAYCLLYKLYTLKLTRKQVNGLLTHTDSPFIRGLGFMYIRYTQPPQDLWDWYEEYLEDEEEIDVKAGDGSPMTMGEMLRSFLTKLEWYATLFPRIPVPIMKDIERKMQAWRAQHVKAALEVKAAEEAAASAEAEEKRASRERAIPRRTPSPHRNHRSASKDHSDRRRHRSRSPEPGGSKTRDRDRKRSRSRDKGRHRDRERRRSRSNDGKRRSRSKGKSHRERRGSKSRDRKRSRSRERKRSRSRERRRSRDRWDHRHRGGDDRNKANGDEDYGKALQRERDRQQREKEKRSKRSSSKEHRHRSRSR